MRMADKIMGLDVGGAHTDAALVRLRDEGMVVEDTERIYLPLWKKRNHHRLERLIRKLARRWRPDAIGLTMSGELADAFPTRKDGVKFIVKATRRATRRDVFVVTSEGELVDPEEAIAEWRKVAGANWRASSELLASVHGEDEDFVFCDFGSTTLDIIPIMEGEVKAKGRTDYERLKHGELIYVGFLRTPLSYLLDRVIIDGNVVEVSYEYFSIVADALTVLGIIGEEEYTVETPDGRGKSYEECARRLARVVCSDPEEIGEEGVIEIAKQAFKELFGRVFKHVQRKVRETGVEHAVTAGSGEEVLMEVFKRLDVETTGFDDVFGEGAEVAPAVGAAYLTAVTLRG